MNNFSNSDAQLAEIYDTYGTADFKGRWVAQDWTLKDKVGYTSSNEFKFFANSSYDANLAVAKKHEQSNFVTPNQIGGQQFFLIQNIRMFIQNSAKARQTGTGVASDTSFAARQLKAAQLITAISAAGVFNFTINRQAKLTVNQPFQTLAAGFGLGIVKPPVVNYTDGTPAAINSAANAYAANSPYDFDGGGQGDPFLVFPMMALAPSTSFEAVLTYPAAVSPVATNVYGAANDQTATLWLCCYLDGQLLRPRS